MDTPFQSTSNENLEILKLAYHDQRSELDYRRMREQQIFASCAFVLLAIIGAVLLPPEPERSFIATHGPLGRGIATALVLLVSLFSVLWQRTEVKAACGNQQALVHILDRLGFFDRDGVVPALSVFPTAWKTWGTRRQSLRGQILKINKLTATVFLGLLALLSVWLA
jgi:hypothetical protein